MTSATAVHSSDYPAQPIHPELVHCLYSEAERLERKAQRASHLELPFDLGSRLVASTLRWLDRQGECLHPRGSEAFSCLQHKALQNLRLRWWTTTKRDYGRADKKFEQLPCQPLEALEGDAWQPVTDLYGQGCSLLGDQGRFPGDDLLGGETGRRVLETLTGEFGLLEERALAIVLSCILKKFPRVEEALREMGYGDFSSSYLRKWTGQEAPEVLKRLQPRLREWGIGACAPDPPPEGTERKDDVFVAIVSCSNSIQGRRIMDLFHSLNPLSRRNAGRCSADGSRSECSILRGVRDYLRFYPTILLPQYRVTIYAVVTVSLGITGLSVVLYQRICSPLPSTVQMQGTSETYTRRGSHTPGARMFRRRRWRHHRLG